MNVSLRILLQSVAAVAVAGALAGCAARYDAQGNVIYRWQFGQDTQRDIDYSNPRLPILPKQRPSTELWPLPSPYEFNDLSRYSFLQDTVPVPMTSLHVGDNAACAACSDSSTRLALLAVRADARNSRGAAAAR